MSGSSALQQFWLSLTLRRTLVVALLKGWEVEVSSIYIHTLGNKLQIYSPVGCFYTIHSCFDAEKLMFALKYAMTQLKCCKKDKVGETIKEVLVIEEVSIFNTEFRTTCCQQ